MKFLKVQSYAQACSQDRAELTPGGAFLCAPPELPVPDLGRPEFFYANIPTYGPLQYSYPPRYIYSLPGASIVSNTYAVITQNQVLIRDSYCNNIPQLEQSGVLKVRAADAQTQVAAYTPNHSPRRLHTSVFLPVSFWYRNYHHWLIETVPLLIRYKNCLPQPDTRLIMSGSLAPFHLETLQLLGLKDRVLTYPTEGLWCPTLYVPELGIYAPDHLFSVRNAFLENARLRPKLLRKIYISRVDSNSRRVLNENELKPILEKEGYEWICLEGMSLTAQIKCFSEAQIIIGPHGAGLSNMLFSHTGTRVIEFLPEDQVNHCFWIMANILGHRYTYLTGRVKNAQRDMYISPAVLQRLLSAIE